MSSTRPSFVNLADQVGKGSVSSSCSLGVVIPITSPISTGTPADPPAGPVRGWEPQVSQDWGCSDGTARLYPVYPVWVDPVTAAILGALAAGGLAGLNDVVSKAVGDAYASLKSLIKRRSGNEDVSRAIVEVEAKPASAGRRATLEEEVVAAGLDRDEEVLAAARELLERLGGEAVVGQVTQQAFGSGIAQATHGSTATVYPPPPPPTS